jgi:hypothetical protein
VADVARKQECQSRAVLQRSVTRNWTHKAHGLIALAYAIVDPILK